MASGACNDDGSDWDEAEEMESEATPTMCLFCSRVFSSPELVFQHCSEQHGFSVNSTVARLNLDCFSYIKMINYIRCKDVTPETLQKVDPSNVPWSDDKYLQPTLPDDLLLTYGSVRLDNVMFTVFFSNQVASMKGQVSSGRCGGRRGQR